jgi:predicted ATPase
MIDEFMLSGMLSYGWPPRSVKLGPLNVLIGPNASGKSNLLAVIGLLRACPDDLTVSIRQGGGLAEWRWKGRSPPTGYGAPMLIHASLADWRGHPGGLTHTMSLFGEGPRFTILSEEVGIGDGRAPTGRLEVATRNEGLATLLAQEPASGVPETGTPPQRREVKVSGLSLDQSILSQVRDPTRYPEITFLQDVYRRIKLYGDLDVGRHSPPRVPQPTDLPGDFLLEDASNIGMVVNALDRQPGGLRMLEDRLRRFCGGIERVGTSVNGGTIQVVLYEKGLTQPIPATRISDGTLRYLCLLTILCHPKPPPLICIEEPELGLHPDVLPVVAELLVEASQRTQLIVTTHSDLLVSGLSEVPESVLVCERDEEGTRLRRLEKDKLAEWLEKYSLGDLWLKGEIGGTLT